MISIVICSTRPTITEAFEKNIRDTIGVDCELIIIDNSANKYSIFAAYNKGLTLCRYSNICFIHEDILFHTNNWGKVICQHLKDPSCGFVGFSGGTYLADIPSGWSFFQIVEYYIQTDKKHKERKLKDSGDFNKQSFKAVAALDGFFLSARKEVFDTIKFDDINFKGFHFYDMDICLQALALGLKNRVLNNVLIEHFSKGKQNRAWVEDSLIFWQKWRNLLPISLIETDPVELQKKEFRYLKNNYLKRMVRGRYATKEIVETMHLILKQRSGPETDVFFRKLRLHIFLMRLSKCPSSFFNKKLDALTSMAYTLL